MVKRTSRPDLPLVTDHMPQSLVVDDSDINIRLELLARDARVHGLIPVIVVPRQSQLLAKVVGGSVVLGKVEGRAVLRETV